MAKVISVNFEGVEVGGTSAKIKEGDYGFKITKVVSKKAASSGNPILLFSLKVISGDKSAINKTLLHNCTLTKNSLWNLRNLLEATGKSVPAKAIKIDLDKLVGLTLAGTVIDDEYQGKKKSTISAFFPIADLNPDKSDGDSEDTDDVEETSDSEDTDDSADAEEESAEDEAEELFE